MARHKPVLLPQHMVETVVRAIGGVGVAAHRLPSGAGHDAQIMAAVTDTAMIFVRSRDGISHSPAEFTAADDIRLGAEALYRTVLALDATE